MVSQFIQGISPVAPLIIIFFILILSLFVAWWSYQYLESLSLLKKRTLILLRASSLFILVILLLNPYFLLEYNSEDSQKIAIYIDNSQSLSIERGNYQGAPEYNNLINRFNQIQLEGFELTTFLFSDTVIEDNQPTLTGTRTNINNVLEHLRLNEHRFASAILISDGIITQGRNPIFAAQNLTIPVITIPVGDTTQVKDIAIANIDYSQETYTYTGETISVEIQQEGFENEYSDVQLLLDGEILGIENIQFPTNSSSQILEFYHEFDEPGFYNFLLNIPPKPEEYTDQNNQTSFTIEVQDDKTTILSLSFDIHPDVSSLRRLISSDQQNELISSTWIGGNRFLDNDPYSLTEEPDLIVLHGLPPINSTIFQWIEEQDAPFLIFQSPNTTQLFSEQEIAELSGFQSDSPTGTIDVQLDYQNQSNQHPIMELGNIDTNRFPTLKMVRSNYNLSALAQPLLFATFERLQDDFPVIIASDAPNRRLTTVTANGWYRFEQSPQPEVRQFFNSLFTNIISWTSTSSDRRTLQIYPIKELYTENEIVRVRAELFNERGEPETEAQIELSIYQNDQNTPIQSFLMSHQQNEIYNADLGNYPIGIYRLSAIATRNERIIGTAEDRVNVSESIIEFINTKRDDSTLRLISEITSGIILENLDSEPLMSFLNSLALEDVDQQVTNEFYYLSRNGIWFLLVLTLLSAEWLIRRSASLP
tara:strand:- start:55752 stop:57869 length:2118 start_codon:yes stop_codon:yes gene_type:complete